MDRSGAHGPVPCKAGGVGWLAQECQVSISYAIGKADPVAFDLTPSIPARCRMPCWPAALAVFNLRPAAIIEHLSLRKVRYAQTANYGHFHNIQFPGGNRPMCGLREAVRKLNKQHESTPSLEL